MQSSLTRYRRLREVYFQRRSQLPPNTPWSQVEVVSADGFGNRVLADELRRATSRPIILATNINGQPMSRQQGLVRLIVPSETDDALRQVKWVGRVTVLP